MNQRIKRAGLRLALLTILVAGLATNTPAAAQEGGLTAPLREAIQWLQQSLEQAGLDVPARFDLASVLGLVLQTLELTFDRLDTLKDAKLEDLQQAQASLASAWDDLRTRLDAGAESGGGFLAGTFKRVAGLILVETRGKVSFADGRPAPNILLVQFAGYEQGIVSGQAGVSTPIPSGFAVTDASGNYRLLHAGGLLAAFRYATGQAAALGALGPYLVHPVELLPADPAYRLITYDAQGQPTVTAGQQPLAVWQVLGL